MSISFNEIRVGRAHKSEEAMTPNQSIGKLGANDQNE